MAPRKYLEKSKKRCAVPFCLEKDAEGSFLFPKNEEKGVQWINAVGNDELSREFEKNGYAHIYKKQYHVCSLHFESKFISVVNGRRTLMRVATPLFNLNQEKNRKTQFRSLIFTNNIVHFCTRAKSKECSKAQENCRLMRVERKKTNPQIAGSKPVT